MANKIIQLLKSGDFTVAYHDNGVCSIYKGKHKYEDLPDSIYEPDDTDGYAPEIVELLVKALGGKIDSI